MARMAGRSSRIAAVAGWAALVVTAFILLEIAAVHIGRLSGRRGDDTLQTMLVGFGIVYLAFLALFPAVLWFARRVPVTLRRPWTIAAHVVAALVFATAHLTILSASSWLRAPEETNV